MEGEKGLTFLGHLEELRWRLVKCAIVIVVIGFVLWFNIEWIYDNLFLSMLKSDFVSFKFMCKYLGYCLESSKVDVQSTTMAGQFNFAMQTCIMGAFILSAPFFFYQIWSFVKPGLKTNELTVTKGIIFYVSVLFLAGVLFGYFIVAPLCIQFFAEFQISNQIKNNFNIDSYMSTILSSVFFSGLLFLLPILIYLLTKLGVITPEFLKKYRKHSIIGVLVLSAIITPPEWISQILVAIPIIILYEVGIFVSQRVYNKQKKSELLN